MADKPDCYQCQHRRGIAGDAHSRCVHPSTGEDGALGDLISLMSKRVTAVNLKAAVELNVTGSDHGHRKGWFNWPWNFDPIWLESCNGFDAKETPE